MNIGSVQAAKGTYGRAIYKFGYNAAITTTEEVVWDAGNVYSYIDTAAAAVVVSSSTADDAAGTGAQKIKIEGLDENYEPQTVEVTMDGTTNVTTDETFIAINRMYVTEAGTGEVNAGNITATVGGTTRSQISADRGQTLQAVYTVPAGFTAYITDWMIASGATLANKYLEARLVCRSNDGVRRTKSVVTLNNTMDKIDFGVATVIPEKNSIEIRAVTSSGTDAVSGAFSVLLKRD
jgi:hypothetical protein